MAFLKKHYEKILLAAFLVIFVISLFYQIDIITTTGQVTKEDLKLNERSANYHEMKVDFDSSRFIFKDIFLENSLWNPSFARSKDDRFFTDLMVPFEISRCPHCSKLIPTYFFYNNPHQCPFCEGKLPEPAKKGPGTDDHIDGQDTDGGGIPDIDEAKYGLDPKRPEDDLGDLDKDGFANVYEYKHKTRLDDPTSHPPLYLRLYLERLQKNLLGIKLKNITMHGEDKQDWDIQINFGKTKSEFFWLGETVKVGARKYKIEKVEASKKQVKDGNILVAKTEGSITLKSLDDDETIVAVMGQPVYSANPKAVIVDEGNGQRYVLDMGQTFEVGSSEVGLEKYKVVAIDSAKEVVKLKDLAKGNIVTIDKELKIPKLQKDNINRGDMMPGGIPGEMIDPALEMPGMVPGVQPLQGQNRPRLQ